MTSSTSPGMRKLKVLTRSNIESRAITFAGIATLLTLMISMIVMRYATVTSFSVQSLGFVVALCVALVSSVTFGFGYRNSEARFDIVRSHLAKFRNLMTVFALSFGHGSIGYLLVMALSYVFSSIYPKTMFDGSSAVLIVSSIVAVTSYVVYLHSSNMSARKLAGVFMVFIISGAFASMITSENKFWWQNHFSALGAGSTLSSYAFNLTMIIGGIIIASLADYIVSDFQKIKNFSERYVKIKTRTVRIIFIIIGITMVGVGAFPYDRFRLVHDMFANTMTLVFCLLIVSLPWLVPMFGRAFISLSYAFVAAIVGSYWLFLDGKGSLIVMEVVSALMFFLWLIIFIRQISAVYFDESSARFEDKKHSVGDHVKAASKTKPDSV